MPSQRDYYETLGVKRASSPDEIRKAYKKLARKFHPDLNPGDKSAEERFKEIQEAYGILSDPKKRQMYDQFGFYSENAQPGGGFHPGAEQGFGFDFGGFDFSAFTPGGGGRPGGGEAGFGGFSEIFNQFLGGRGKSRAKAQPQKGTDLEYALNIDFWQSIRGAQIRLKVNRQAVCGRCNGTGSSGGMTSICPQCGGTGTVSQMAGAMRFNLTCPRCNGSGQLRDACPECHGEGRVITADAVEVRIPAGVQSGSRLRVAGKGNAGVMGAPPGDLYITVRVDPHPFFEREGDDIRIRVPVTVWEASLGTKIEVPTIDGRALLKIPQGTHNGQRFRLREKGVMNHRKGVRGDQIVEVSLMAPQARDERTREILRELASLHPEDPRGEIWEQVKAV